MHQEGPVRHRADDDTLHRLEVRGQLLARRLVWHVHRHVPDVLPGGRLDQIDRPEAATPLGDGARDVREHPGMILDLEPNDEPIRGREHGGQVGHSGRG